MDIDALINEYADKLQKIYDHDTAGDYTFIGLLSEFAKKVTESDIREKIRERGL